MKSKYGYEYEVYEDVSYHMSTYARFKYLEHANQFCESLKEQFGCEDIYVRTVKGLTLKETV